MRAKETRAMVRKSWLAVLAAALAWSSNSSAQDSRLMPVAQQAPAPARERTMTVQEMGKSPIKCRILQEWRMPNGAVAYKVEALDRGDFMTIAENPTVIPTESLSIPVAGSTTPMVVKTMTTKIYHWVDGTTPPAGAPLPPQVVEVNPSCGCGTAPASASTCNCQDTAPSPAVRPLFPRLRQALAGRDSTGSGEQIVLPTTTTEIVEQPITPPPSPGTTLGQGVQSASKGNTTPGATVAAPAPTPSAIPGALPPAEPIADSSDWRKSWGQPTDHKTQTVAIDKSMPPSSVTEASRLPDPLVSPDKLVKRGEDKLTTDKPATFHPFDKLPPPPAPPGSETALQTIPPATQPFTGKIPLGVQSVLASGSTPVTQYQYLPVPVVTVPQTRPPSAPAPAIPQPPQPPMFVNAFTPSGVPTNDPQALAMAMAQRQGVATNYPVGPGGLPYPGPGAPPPAVPQQMLPNMAVGYQGPMPPNPYVNAPAVPAGYAAAAPSNAVNPAMDRRGPVVPASATAPSSSEAENLKQQMAMLRDSLFPSQRELAAEGLTTYDWHYYPQVVQALLVAAHEDPAPLVRATCISCLMRMNVRSEAVLNVLGTLKNDADARVRQQAEQALARLHS